MWVIFVGTYPGHAPLFIPSPTSRLVHNIYWAGVKSPFIGRRQIVHVIEPEICFE